MPLYKRIKERLMSPERSFSNSSTERSTPPSRINLETIRLMHPPGTPSPIRPSRHSTLEIPRNLVYNVPTTSLPSRSSYHAASSFSASSYWHSLQVESSHLPIMSSSNIQDNSWFIPVPILSSRTYPFEYQFGGTIGEGGFGKVMLALHLETRREYAIKAISIRRLRSRSETLSIANEIKVLKRIGQTKAPFLARPGLAKDWCWQYRGNVHLVMEYCRGGDLGRDLRKHPELKDPRLFKVLAAELTIALLALHDMGIVHYDVKPANVLVDGQGHCVLTDYGGASFISDQPGRSSSRNSDWRWDKTPIFTLRYAAPEVLVYGTGMSEPAADFWSLGVTLFELATGKPLIDEPDDNMVVHIIRDGQIDLSQLEALSLHPGLALFTRSLLVPDIPRRLQGQSIKMDPYFNDLGKDGWAAIERKERPPFRPSKQVAVNPRNTTYAYLERPGESLLDDANEDIVARWLIDEGVSVPHHRQSEYWSTYAQHTRIGLPYQEVLSGRGRGREDTAPSTL